MTADGGAALAGRYRRLLLAYPRSYRRTHGTEILTTLMDAAPSGRARPTGREVRDLLAGGLRQRFRLPTGRSMMAVAAVSALVLGALGASVGSALGWATAPAFPGDAAFRSITVAALGEPFAESVQRDRQVFGLRPRAIVGTFLPNGWDAGAARTRLVADGWRVGPVTTGSSTALMATGETVRGTYREFVATKGGTEIRVTISETPGERSHGMVMGQGSEPWPMLPLILAGLVAGLLGGWLLTARIGYRVRPMAPSPQMVSISAATIAIIGLGVPAPASYHALVGYLVRKAGPDGFNVAPGVFPGLEYGTPLDPVVLTGFGALLVLIVLTSVSRKRTALGGTTGSADGNGGIPYAA